MNHSNLSIENLIKSKESINRIINLFYVRSSIPQNDLLTNRVIKYVTRDANIPYIINTCEGNINDIIDMLVDGSIKFIQFYIQKNKPINYIEYQNNVIKSVGDEGGGYSQPSVSEYQSSSNTTAVVQQQQQQQQQQSSSNSSSSFSSDDLYRMAMLLNRGSLERKTHILVDTRYRNVSGLQPNRFVFNLVTNNNNSLNPGSGDLSIGGKNIKNIVSMEVPSFNIPFVSVADNFYKKITMTINELKDDKNGAYENYNIHFMFGYESLGLLLKLTPDNTTYKFKFPINPKSLSFSFGSPFVPINFDLDRMYADDLNYLSNNGVISFNQSHNLGSGDIIYITDFQTLNNTANINIIAQINRLEGHVITVESATSISINIDFTTIVDPDINNKPFIYFGSKRIIFPLIFTYLADPGET